jgi:hypothetical protein
VINALITFVSMTGCVAFVVTLLIVGVEPSARRKSGRGEVLSVLPTGKKQNPVPRAFDQVTGVLESVPKFDLDYRAEFVPLSMLEDPQYSVEHFIRNDTKLVIAPGTSSGTELVFPPRYQSLSHPVLLTSVTGTATIDRLEALGATITAKKNQEMATPIAASISKATDKKCRDAIVYAEPGDKAYSEPLANDIRIALEPVCSDDAADGNVYVLVGNDSWWESGGRPDLTNARFVFLSDGLASGRVLRGIERAARGADIYALGVQIAAPPASCVDGEDRALQGREAVQHTWHIVAHEATCIVLASLRSGKSPELSTEVSLKRLARHGHGHL